MVDPPVSLDVIRDDPEDNRVLECAVGGNANFIVSGDKHLLAIKEYLGIVILSPAEFLRLLALHP
jgi:predicted nucleic acid-binding protein